jgi:signal transduction histidine kinase
MFACISHELRTPLNGKCPAFKFLAISNSIYLLKQDGLAQECINLLDICDTSCLFLLTLINDSLDYAQMESGNFKISYGDVCVH